MATGCYERIKRTYHSTIVIKDSIYCWGGYQKGLPMVHDNEDKRQITSSVNIFHLPTFQWERKLTIGNPPSGVMFYACTNLENKIFYFGGSCKVDDCFHNNLFKLNSLTNKWEEIVSMTPDNEPMKKRGCGMISYSTDGKDNFLLFGGFGPIPTSKQTQSQYIPLPNKPNLCCTNEAHITCVSSSPGQWKIPVITGTRPPPCAYFSFNALPGNRGVMFGGTTVDETGKHRVNDLFLFTCFQDTIDFQKVVKSCDSTVEWPKGRTAHASAIINTISSNEKVTSHLIVIGGRDYNGDPICDCWIMNLSCLIWYQINLPELVTKRFFHSMSTYYISKSCVWIIVTGGYRDSNRSDNGAIFVTGCDITVTMELATPYNNIIVYTNDVWTVGDVWNSKKIPKSKQRSSGFLSNVFGKSDRSFQVENSILSQQLTESKQDRKETEITLQEVIESQQQEIQQSNTRHQETQSQLEEMQFQLQISDTRLQETQSQLEETQSQLQVSDNGLQETRSQLQDTQVQLQLSDTRLQETQSRLEVTQSQLQETQVQLQHAQQNLQDGQQQIQDLNRRVQEYNQTILQAQQDIHHLHETTQRKEHTIRRLQSQIENPHWLLQNEELEMTNEILGKGGWCQVKVAIFRGTKVAAKCLHEVIIAEHNLHLFSREMDIASHVRHPNLLRFIGATRVGNPIIITELMPTSLRKELEKGPLTRPQIIMISCDVSSALNYLHLWKPQPILHRDVSSANVLLEPSVNRRWKGKLCDYGSANFLHQVSTVAPGSPIYSAPEALFPHLHSPAMDVYSFGILLLEMATCRLPSTISFEREGQICEVRYPSIKTLVERCTSRDPQFRPIIGKVLQDINAI